jgi:hypothetical protein
LDLTIAQLQLEKIEANVTKMEAVIVDKNGDSSM